VLAELLQVWVVVSVVIVPTNIRRGCHTIVDVTP